MKSARRVKYFARLQGKLDLQNQKGFNAKYARETLNETGVDVYREYAAGFAEGAREEMEQVFKEGRRNEH